MDQRGRECGAAHAEAAEAVWQTTFVNVVDELGNLIRGQVTARITLEAWWTNMQQGWVWDLDDLTVNQIGHPYQGSNFQYGTRKRSELLRIISHHGLSERQWGTVREDYSHGGDAWDCFSHEPSRSRAYQWGEDGLGGISDDKQRLCFAVALWNGRDPISWSACSG